MEIKELFKKFEVKRIDGQPELEGAAYFVLDVINDPLAGVAIEAYANAVRGDGVIRGQWFGPCWHLSQELDQLLKERTAGWADGPAATALRTPR